MWVVNEFAMCTLPWEKVKCMLLQVGWSFWME